MSMIGYLVRPIVVGVFVCSLGLGSARRIASALVEVEPSAVATSGIGRCISGGHGGPIQKVLKDEYGPIVKIIFWKDLLVEKVFKVFFQ